MCRGIQELRQVSVYSVHTALSMFQVRSIPNDELTLNKSKQRVATPSEQGIVPPHTHAEHNPGQPTFVYGNLEDEDGFLADDDHDDDSLVRALHFASILLLEGASCIYFNVAHTSALASIFHQKIINVLFSLL